MHCQICKKNAATIHLTEISEGHRTELHLCESCAIQQGIAAKTHISVKDLLAGLLASQPSEEELFGPEVADKACPVCGFRITSLNKEGLMGCPHDYEVFEDVLVLILERAHDGKSRHIGKVPSRAGQGTKRALELARLKEQLKAAVRDEQYELAARLRDQIQQLEGKCQGGMPS
ncbi:MAG: UvrB/UvrC motif-containing protein [Sedimentisphaerales bacterium]|jgi:protein arginine kinase activator|nr:UvrB/UvrC motif-containing protein [Sedimentisphaerales bacterium]